MELLSLIIFIFCAAMAAGSFLLLSRLMEEHHLPFLRSLFYHIIFMSTFGFYGIWGQFMIVAFAGDKLTPEALSIISVISLLLGLPFLVFGWLMLIRCGTEYSGLRFRGYSVALFLIVNTGLIAGLGILVKDMEFSGALKAFKYYYSASSLLFSLITAMILVRNSPGTARLTDRLNMALLIIASSLSQALLLLLMPHSAWMALIFVFLLFSGITLLPVYLTYKADLGVIRDDGTAANPEGMEDFFSRHEISPREAEIIREICNGLSNQEIADKLFISLQTVKDHTSRIYAKTNVRNRMQLMTLVQNLNNT